MTNRVHVRRLKLDRFRNYRQLALDFDERHIVLTGDNGAGKTNLMEAVSLLSPGRGLRRAVYGDMVLAGDGDEGFAVFAAIEGMAGPADIGTGAGGSGEPATRRLRINAASALSGEALLDHLRVLWLTPAMDGLFTGPAGDRRRFLDRMVLSLDPLHGRRAADYERAMRGRNRLLAENRLDPVWLDGIEIQMAELGIAMALARQDFIALMQGAVERLHADSGAFPKALMKLTGYLSDGKDNVASQSATDMETALVEALGRARRRDQAAGRTLDGPHRSDLAIRHAGKDMPAALCSTGEQKALLVGLVIAHARLVGDLAGAAPLLLLDEIAAHLDAGRRAALFDLLDGLDCQTIMTGTDKAMFSALGNRAQLFTIHSANVMPAGWNDDPEGKL